MKCDKCGYTMDAFDTECPRCRREQGVQQGVQQAVAQHKPVRVVAVLPPDATTPEIAEENEALDAASSQEDTAPTDVDAASDEQTATPGTPITRSSFIVAAILGGLLLLVWGLIYIPRIIDPASTRQPPPAPETGGTSTVVHRIEISRRSTEGVPPLPAQVEVEVEPPTEAQPDPAHQLAWACDEGKTETVKQLLDQGVSANTKWLGEFPVLTIAAMSGHEAIVELLLSRGADVDALAFVKTDEGESIGISSLIGAAGEGHEAVVQTLLKYKAAVNGKSTDGSTPLHWCALQNQPAVARILISNGADVNMKQRSGIAPLWYAVIQDHRDMINVFLENGADVNTANKLGSTPLDYVVQKGRAELAEILRKAGGKLGSEMAVETPVKQ